MKFKTALSAILVPALINAVGLLPLAGMPSGAVMAKSASQEESTDLPDLKPLKPKMHKVEPYKAGVEHNAYLKKKNKKKQARKKSKRRYKAKTKKQNFAGRSLFGSGLDNGGLNSSVESNRLNSSAKRGIGIIGVKFVAYRRLPPVINVVFPGTPAAGAGLRPNDAIVAVDGVPTFGLSKEECYDLIVGSPNTPVTLSIRRGSSFKVHTMTRMDFTELTDPSVRKAYGVHL